MVTPKLPKRFRVSWSRDGKRWHTYETNKYPKLDKPLMSIAFQRVVSYEAVKKALAHNA